SYHTADTEFHPLSLHDALPISSTSDSLRFRRRRSPACCHGCGALGLASSGGLGWRFLPICATSWTRRRVPWMKPRSMPGSASVRSEEHTSELQSRVDLVCRLLL